MLFVFCAGCGRDLPALEAPVFDPSAAAAAAMQQYDGNGDGVIKAGELKQAPSLNFSLDRIDTNGDGVVDKEEAGVFHDAFQAAVGDNDIQKLDNLLNP